MIDVTVSRSYPIIYSSSRENPNSDRTDDHSKTLKCFHPCESGSSIPSSPSGQLTRVKLPGSFHTIVENGEKKSPGHAEYQHEATGSSFDGLERTQFRPVSSSEIDQLSPIERRLSFVRTHFAPLKNIAANLSCRQQSHLSEYERFSLHIPTQLARVKRLLQNSKPILWLDKTQSASTISNSIGLPLWSKARGSHRSRSSASYRATATTTITRSSYENGLNRATQLIVLLVARSSHPNIATQQTRHESFPPTTSFHRRHKHHLHDTSLPPRAVPPFFIVASHAASIGEWIGLADTGGPRSDGQGRRRRRGKKRRCNSEDDPRRDKDHKMASRLIPGSGTLRKKSDKRRISRFKEHLLKRIVKDSRMRNSTGGAPASCDENNEGWRSGSSLVTLELFDHFGHDYFENRGFASRNSAVFSSPERNSIQPLRRDVFVEDDFVPSPDAKPPCVPLILPPAPLHGYYDPGTGQIFHVVATSSGPANTLISPVLSPGTTAPTFPILIMNPVTGTGIDTTAGASFQYWTSSRLPPINQSLPSARQQEPAPQQTSKDVAARSSHCCRGCISVIAEEKQTEILLSHQSVPLSHQPAKFLMDSSDRPMDSAYPKVSIDRGISHSVRSVSDYEVPSEHPANEPQDSMHARSWSAGLQRRLPSFHPTNRKHSDESRDEQGSGESLNLHNSGTPIRRYKNSLIKVLPDSNPLVRGSWFSGQHLRTSVVADPFFYEHDKLHKKEALQKFPSLPRWSWLNWCNANPTALQRDELTIAETRTDMESPSIKQQ